MTSVFIDTNVFVYGHDRSRPKKRARAREVLRQLEGPDYRAMLSTQVLQEFYNTLTRKLLMPPAEARIELEALTALNVVLIHPLIILDAMDLHAQASISFWDSLLIAAAQSVDCDEIWTEDLQDGERFGRLKVVNPFKGIPEQ